METEFQKMIAGRETPADTAKKHPGRVDGVRQDDQVSEASPEREATTTANARPGRPRARGGREPEDGTGAR